MSESIKATRANVAIASLTLSESLERRFDNAFGVVCQIAIALKAINHERPDQISLQ